NGEAAAPAFAVEAPESHPESIPPLTAKRRNRRAPIIYSIIIMLAINKLVATFKLLLCRSLQTPTPRGINSIALLPLENVSGDPQQEYLSDGLTDAVTNLLAQIADLRVISRTTAMHYKHTAKTTPEIAKELGVDALVEGSVIRSSNHLRLTVQLVQ